MPRASGYVPDRGEIIRLDLDPQAGREQAGRRPVLVLSPASYNAKSNLAVICPLTNKTKGYPFEVSIEAGAVTDGSATGVILADQVRSLDWVERNAEYFATLDDETVNQVTGLVLALIDPDGIFGPSEAS
jgi:mRNA interferase MazF